MPSSRRSSYPRDQTQVSCIGGIRDTREALLSTLSLAHSRETHNQGVLELKGERFMEPESWRKTCLESSVGWPEVAQPGQQRRGQGRVWTVTLQRSLVTQGSSLIAPPSTLLRFPHHSAQPHSPRGGAYLAWQAPSWRWFWG